MFWIIDALMTLAVRLWGFLRPEMNVDNVYLKFVRYGKAGLSAVESTLLLYTREKAENDFVCDLNKDVMCATAIGAEMASRSTGTNAVYVAVPTNIDSDTESTEYEQATVPLHPVTYTFDIPRTWGWRHLKQSIIDTYTKGATDYFDRFCWDGKKVHSDVISFPTGFSNRPVSILEHPKTVDHISLGKETAAGYIEVLPPGTQGDSSLLGANHLSLAVGLEDMIQHLPTPYRSRSKWYMNKRTALYIGKLKDADGNFLVAPPSDNSVYWTERLLGKPIVINDNMDDLDTVGGIPIMLADLTRGYLLARHKDYSPQPWFNGFHKTNRRSGQLIFTHQQGGDVIRLEAFKFIKVVAALSKLPTTQVQPELVANP